MAPRVAALLARVPWQHVSGPYQALDLRFGVRTTDPALGAYLARTFAPFLDRGATSLPDHWWSICERDGDPTPTTERRRYRVFFDSSLVVAAGSPHLALAYPLWSFNQQVIGRASGALLLHASAVERDGAVAVFPATQESGKTTLATGMLRRGWHYVTDECVAIDIATGALRPFPKALSIDEGSWPLFPELAPDIPDDQRRYLRDQWHVPATTISEVTSADQPQVRLVVSPRYIAGAATELQPVSRANGLLLLAANSFNPASWGAAGLASAAALIAGAACGELRVGSLADACDAIERAMDAALAGTSLDAVRMSAAR